MPDIFDQIHADASGAVATLDPSQGEDVTPQAAPKIAALDPSEGEDVTPASQASVVAAPPLTGDALAARQHADAELDQMAHPLRNTALRQVEPSPSLIPKSLQAVPKQTLDERQVQRFMPNPVRFVPVPVNADPEAFGDIDGNAQPKPETFGDLAVNARLGNTTAGIPGAPVRLSAPLTARQTAPEVYPVDDAGNRMSQEVLEQNRRTMGEDPNTGELLPASSELNPVPDLEREGSGLDQLLVKPTVQGAEQLKQGVQQLGSAWGNDFSFNSADAKQGLTKTITGLMGVSTPLVAAELGGNPMAVRALAAGIAGGYVTGEAARRGARALGLDPDSQDLAQVLGGIAGGTTAAGMTGYRPGARPEILPPERPAVEVPEEGRLLAAPLELPTAPETPQIETPQIEAGSPVRGQLTAGGSALSTPTPETPPLSHGPARTEFTQPIVLPPEPRATPSGAPQAQSRLIVGPDGKVQVQPAGELPESVDQYSIDTPERTAGVRVVGRTAEGQPITRRMPGENSPVPVVGGVQQRQLPAPQPFSAQAEPAPPPPLNEATARTRIAPRAAAANPVPTPARGMTVDERGNLIPAPAGLLTAQASPAAQDVQQAAELKAHLQNHPAGRVTGIDQATGLPIVDRAQPPAGPAAEVISPQAAHAADRTAKQPDLKAEIALSSGQPQPIGATEPKSGRLITQPSDNPAVNQALATTEMPEYRAGLQDAVRNVPGAELVASRPAKNPARLAEKIKGEGQPAETINDYGAAQITVDSPQARDAVAAAVQQQFPVVRVQDNFDHGDPEYHYRSYSMQLQMPNGSSQELQIVPREVHDANAAEHEKYKEARNKQLAGEKATDLVADAKAQNDAAMAKFNARNGRTEQYERNSGGGTAVTEGAGQRQANALQDERGGTALAARQAEVGAEGGSGRESLAGGSGAEAGTAEGSGGKVAQVSTNSLSLDAQRFQYKLNTSSEGVTDLLKGRRWNDDLSGVISVWRDPADGKTYVVNGHHRAVLAKEQGVPTVSVRYLKEPSAAAARATGALQNIAEGRGTPLDAAKFFRDSGLSPQDIDAKGISMGEATAANGLALANLSDPLFNDAVQGRIPIQRAIAIGRAAPTVEQQEALTKLLARAEAHGKRVPNETIEELGRLVRGAGTHTSTQDTLFGTQEQTKNLALEKADVSAYIRGTLRGEHKLFSHVSDTGRADQLSTAGNKIKVKSNATIAERAAQAQAIYDLLSTRSGPLNDILNTAAARLAKGDDAHEVKREAYRDARAALAETLRGGEGSSSTGVQGHPGREISAQEKAGNEPSAVTPSEPAPPNKSELEDAGQEPLLNRRRAAPVRPEDSRALPGMEGSDQDRAAVAAEEQGQHLTGELNSPKGDIEKDAGEMERNSPLFEGSEANPQGSLFNIKEARERSPEENLQRVDHSVIPAHGIYAPIIELNDDALAFLENEGVFNGQRVNAALVPALDANDLEESLRELGNQRNLPEVVSLAESIAKNRGRSGGVIFSRRSLEPAEAPTIHLEEHWHDWQFFRSGAHRSGVSFARRRNPEAWDRAAQKLLSDGYTPVQVPFEIPAKIASGDGSATGLSEAEQKAILQDYRAGIRFNGGNSIMEGLPDFPAALANLEAKNEAHSVNGIQPSAQNGESSQGTERTSDSIRTRGSQEDRQEPTPGGSGEDSVSERPQLYNLASPVRDYFARESGLIRASREIHSGLQDLDPKYDADVLRANELLRSLPGTPADQEQVYHHLEDPSVPLTKTQRDILAQLQPLQKQSEEIFQRLYPEKQQVANYVHRIAQQKGSLLDRIVNNGSKSTGKGNLLKRSAAAGKKRSMMVLESPKGERQVVSVGRGRVTAWHDGAPADIGPLRSGLTNPDEILDERLEPLQREESKLRGEQRTLSETPSRQAVAGRRLQNIANRLNEIDAERSAIEHEHVAEKLPSQVWRDKNGDTWTFKQATTKEIERETPVEYYKNAAASTITNWLELRKAGRAADYLDALKSNPDFLRLSIKPSNPGQIPDGWKSTQLPQFAGYYFEPHVAEVLDEYNNQLRKPDPSVLAKANNFLTTAIFLNPVAHLPNLTANWLTEKGISPLDVRRWGSEFRAGVRAFNAVAHQNRDFLAALDAGAPLQSQKQEVRQFAATLAKRLQKEAEDPGVLAKLKDALGSVAEENPLLIPGAIRWLVENLSSKITWPINDLYFLQSAYAKMDRRGMSLPQALQDTAQYIPDERLPVRVLNSKALGDMLRSPALMFTRYHYGVLKGWGKILANVSGVAFHEAGENAKGEPVNAAGRTKAEESARAVSIAAGLALALTVIYPEIDKLLAAATGNKDARLRRAGYLTVADAARRAVEGDETPLQAARVAVTPSVLAETTADLAANRDLLWNGRRIYNPHGTGKEIGEEVGSKLADEVSPAQLAMRVSESHESKKQALLGLVSVSFPRHGALRLAAELRAEHMPDNAETPAERKKSILRSQARYLGWQGDLSGVAEARKSGLFTPKEMQTLSLQTAADPLLFEAKGLGIKDLLTLYGSRVTTPADRDKLRPLLIRKAPAIQRIADPDERNDVRQRLAAALKGGK